MTLVLIGPPAAGKSRIGKRVARNLGVAFVDTDKLIVEAHGPIPEIFETRGEPYFRTIERTEVVRALGTEAVVSFGGGAVLDPDTQRDLAAHAVVLLTVQPHAVVGRLGSGKRPLATDIDAWIALYERRREIYERLADHTVDTTDRPTDLIAADIAEWARTQPRARTRADTGIRADTGTEPHTEEITR